MMTHHLRLLTQAHSDCIERILRTTRHRGFELCSLTVALEHNTPAPHQVIELEVKSERAIALLLSQLEKLIDVTFIELRSPQLEQVRA